MKIITLSDELNLEKSTTIQIFDYCSSQEIVKQQIILDQNTFSFLREGSKEVFFNDSTLSINNSEFLVMKSGNCLMTEKFSEIKNYRSILLFFSNDSLVKFIQKNNIEIIKQHEWESVFSFKYDKYIERFIESLLDISNLEKNIKDKLLKVKFEEIMLYLTEKYGSFFVNSLIKNNDVDQKFTQTIESNILNKLKLNELAFLCNMSISTFKRKFEKHYSESPSKWFQNKRLEYAHYLLSQKQKSPSEIYFEVGYENLSSFIQAYKTKYGATPKQYQKT